MANILTAAEAAIVLRCEATDTNLLQLLPLVDAYIKQATGRDWTADTSIRAEAKSAARMLITRWHEDPGGMVAGSSMGFGLSAALTQLESVALELAESGVPSEALALVGSQPQNGDDNVAVAGNLTLIFNHEMDAGSTSAVSLQTSDGAPVTVVKSLDVTTRIMTINPTGSLAAATMYDLIITAAADQYGQTYTETITFTTA